MKKATMSVARHHRSRRLKFDQMLKQRLLGVVDVLHGSGRFSGGRVSGWLSSNGSDGSALWRLGNRRHGIGLTGLWIVCVRRDAAA